MARSARKFSQTFNGAVSLNIGGQYFKLLSTVSAVLVQLYNKGQIVLDANGVEGGFYLRGPFDRVDITTSANELVEWLTSDEEGGSDRFTGTFTAQGTLGTLAQVLVNAFNYLRVQVQGKGDAETDSGAAFIAATLVNNVAAEFAKTQIKNPAASGKVVYVDKLSVTAGGGAETFIVGFHDTDLATTTATEVNKDKGGAASTAQLRQANGIAAGFTTFARGLHVANTVLEFVFDPPLKLGAGEGVACENISANVTHTATWAYREYNA